MPFLAAALLAALIGVVITAVAVLTASLWFLPTALIGLCVGLGVGAWARKVG